MLYVCVFIYLYIHNKYTQYTHIFVNKLLFWMRLVGINHFVYRPCSVAHCNAIVKMHFGWVLSLM